MAKISELTNKELKQKFSKYKRLVKSGQNEKRKLLTALQKEKMKREDNMEANSLTRYLKNAKREQRKAAINGFQKPFVVRNLKLISFVTGILIYLFIAFHYKLSGKIVSGSQKRTHELEIIFGNKPKLGDSSKVLVYSQEWADYVASQVKVDANGSVSEIIVKATKGDYEGNSTILLVVEYEITSNEFGWSEVVIYAAPEAVADLIDGELNYMFVKTDSSTRFKKVLGSSLLSREEIVGSYIPAMIWFTDDINVLVLCLSVILTWIFLRIIGIELWYAFLIYIRPLKGRLYRTRSWIIKSTSEISGVPEKEILFGGMADIDTSFLIIYGLPLYHRWYLYYFIFTKDKVLHISEDSHEGLHMLDNLPLCSIQKMTIARSSFLKVKSRKFTLNVITDGGDYEYKITPAFAKHLREHAEKIESDFGFLVEDA
jgi:hypothetical protein